MKDTDEVSWGLFPAGDKNLQREVGRGSRAMWKRFAAADAAAEKEKRAGKNALKSAVEMQHSTHNGKKIINKQINNDDDPNEEKPGWRLRSPEASLPVIWPPASSHCSPSAATASSRCANGTFFWILPADCTV